MSCTWLLPTEHLPDSYFLVRYRTGSTPTRLHTYWKEPLKVISNNRSEYLLLDLITSKIKPYHVSNLKPFRFDTLQTDTLDIARRDYVEFFVEKILDMTGDVKRVSTLTFLVEWLGYDDTHTSWEPWKDVRDTTEVHVYLRANNIDKFQDKYIASYQDYYHFHLYSYLHLFS
jgi:hypothetical protein